MDAAVGALIGVTGTLGGVLIGYLLSGSRARREWRAAKRTEVVSELYRLLSRVEATAELATRRGVSPEVSKRGIMSNREALEELVYYFHGHALWLDAETLPDIQPYINDLTSALGPYEAELNQGTPDSLLATRAAEHVQRIVPQGQQVLGAQFRAIVYPKTWREHLANGLEWLETRSRKSA
jgi:hypothetical protein